METVTADRWLYARLTGDATLMGLVTGVHTWPVPASAKLPYVLFQEQSALDVQALGPQRIMVNGLWLVRVVGEASGWTGALEAAANRIDTLLQAAAGSVAQGNIWACVRERPFRLIETAQQGTFRHLGGIYRLYVK